MLYTDLKRRFAAGRHLLRADGAGDGRYARPVENSGEIRLGYRTDAPPLAFNDEEGQATGYSVDLCRRIATAVKDELKLGDLKVTFVPLTSAERIDAIVKNRADIECGATTITLSREEKVDFTVMTFVTGGSVLSLAVRNRRRCGGGWEVRGCCHRHDFGSGAQDPPEEPDRRENGHGCESRGGHEAAGCRAGRCFRLDQIVIIGLIIRSADPGIYAWSVTCSPTSPTASSSGATI